MSKKARASVFFILFFSRSHSHPLALSLSLSLTLSLYLSLDQTFALMRVLASLHYIQHYGSKFGRSHIRSISPFNETVLVI